MSLVVVGGTVVDLIIPRVARLPQWPRHTEFTSENLALLSAAPIVTLGGNGANAAYVAARCGAGVTLHTQLGSDPMGGLARSWLEQAGCRVRTADRSGTTAINVTAANARKERATFFYPGTPAVMPVCPPVGRRPDYLLASGWPHPPLAAIAGAMRDYRQRGTFTALDVGPILTRPWSLASLRPVFAELDLFLGNEHEVLRITGEKDIAAALARLRSRFDGHVVIKRGGEGALLLSQGCGKIRPISGLKVKAVNTVGAGDSFNGALLAALVRGEELPDAVHEACAVAASVVSSGCGVLGVRPPRHLKTKSKA